MRKAEKERMGEHAGITVTETTRAACKPSCSLEASERATVQNIKITVVTGLFHVVSFSEVKADFVFHLKCFQVHKFAMKFSDRSV